VRPLRDRVLVRPIEYKHATLFVAGIELRKGEVVAVGPGRRLRRRIPWMMPSDGAQGQSINPGQTFYVEDGAETGKISPVPVKIGDVVEYGFRDCFPVLWQGERLLMIWTKNIYGTSDKRADSGILEPISAAID
jgi:co-chaperonin GroES (HSP10)